MTVKEMIAKREAVRIVKEEAERKALEEKKLDLNDQFKSNVKNLINEAKNEIIVSLQKQIETQDFSYLPNVRKEISTRDILKFFDEPELKNKVEMIWKEIGEEGLELRVITYVNEIVLIFQVVI